MFFFHYSEASGLLLHIWIDELLALRWHGHLLLELLLLLHLLRLLLHHLLLRVHHVWLVAVHDLLLLGLHHHSLQWVHILGIHEVVLDNVVIN